MSENVCRLNGRATGSGVCAVHVLCVPSQGATAALALADDIVRFAKEAGSGPGSGDGQGCHPSGPPVHPLVHPLVESSILSSTSFVHSLST